MADRSKVQITLESIQDDGEPQVSRYTGDWFRKELSMYVRYEEQVEAEGGAAQSIRTVIRMREDELTLTRRGLVNSEQLFVPGVRMPGSYRSPYTAFQLHTVTRELRYRTSSNGVLVQGADVAALEPSYIVEWKYDLIVNEELSGRFHIRLHIQGEPNT
ncbi:DUF1934 domain-containing protein [Paenibacillus sp. GCM10023252]|uniref:DUF1934 domain-containing protein n=1 Tax=Paenibacillus sp. GCM10023252 TaxID=3252649 RepID=UPI003614822A